MKKNKTIAYLMAATLLVGGAFVGTKAWFSDQVTTDNGITITMGELKLEFEGSKDDNEKPTWKLVRDESTISEELGNKKETSLDSANGDIKNAHVNIRPGDQFERKFTVSNTGSLDQIVKVEGDLDNGYNDDLFDLTINDENNDFIGGNEFRLNKGEAKTITLTLTTNPSALINAHQGNAHQGGRPFDFNDISKVTLTGRQINADDTQLSPEHGANR